MVDSGEERTTVAVLVDLSRMPVGEERHSNGPREAMSKEAKGAMLIKSKAGPVSSRIVGLDPGVWDTGVARCLV